MNLFCLCYFNFIIKKPPSKLVEDDLIPVYFLMLRENLGSLVEKESIEPRLNAFPKISPFINLCTLVVCQT